MDFRKTFDKIPERFDKYRLRYCKELFQELEMACELNFGKKYLKSDRERVRQQSLY